MGRTDFINIPDMSEVISKKIIEAVNNGIQKAEKSVRNSTVKINGMNIQVDTATQGVIEGLNKQIEEINKKKDKIHSAIDEIYSYKPNGNKKYAISQTGNSYALTEQQTKAIQDMVNASQTAGKKITASEKQQLELQFRLINAKDELIDRIKSFQSADKNSYNSEGVKQYYKDVVMLEKVMQNLHSLSQETKLQTGFNTKGIDVKALKAEVQNENWIAGKLTQGLENELATLQNRISSVMQNAQRDLVSGIMNDNPLSQAQKQISDAEKAINTSYSNIEQRVNKLVTEINSSWAIVNDPNANQKAIDNAEAQITKSITILEKYKDFLKGNADVSNILNDDNLNLYIDTKKIKTVKDSIIEDNNAIISSNRQVISSNQEYIKNLDWAKGDLGIAHGDAILKELAGTISSLREENEKLKASLETTGQVSNDEFNKLQRDFTESSNLIKQLETVVSNLQSKIQQLESEKKKLEEKPITGGTGTGTGTGGSGSGGSGTGNKDPLKEKDYTEYLTQIKQATDEISNKLKSSLIDSVTKFKEELQSTSNLSYTKMFESLRNSLRDIVNEFQTSLTNIRFGNSNNLYDTLKGWNDASRYMSGYNSKSDAERAAFANLGTGAISNSYVFDKNNAFSNKLLEILNKASQGIEQDISKVYDTWIHSHPVESSKSIKTAGNKFETVAMTGSDVGFSVADLNTWVKQGLESGLKNMLVTNNYKYTKLDLTDVSKEKFEEFKKEFIKNLKESGVKADGITGDTVVPLSIKGTGSQKYIDLDEKTNTINSAMIKASETVFGANRLTTGNITDLIKDVDVLSAKEKEAYTNSQELFSILNRINEVLNNSNKTPQFGISEEYLNNFVQQISSVIELINNVNNSSKNNGTNAVPGTNVGTTGMKDEVEQAEALRKKITEVTTAVDNKTNAFRQEEQVVIGTVQREITNLETLDGQLTIILQDIQRIIDKPLKVNIDYSSIDQLSKLDENGKSSIDKLKASIDGLQTGVLSDLGKAFSGLQLPSDISSKIEELAKALELLKTTLSNVDSGSLGFLDSIKDIVKEADKLKDLATVINASKEEIQRAKSEIEQQKNPVDVQGVSAKNIAIGTKEWDKAIEKAKDYKDIIGEVHKITYNFRRDSDGKYYKSFSFFGEKGKAVEGKDGALLYGNEIKHLDEVTNKTSSQMDELIKKFEDAAEKAKLVYNVGSLRIDDNGIITFTTTVEELGNKAITTKYKIEDLNEALSKDGSLSKDYLNNHAENKNVKDLSKEHLKEQLATYRELNSLIDQYISKKNSAENAKDPINKAVLNNDATIALDKIQSKLTSIRNDGLLTENQINKALERLNISEDELTRRLEVRKQAQDELGKTKMAEASYDRELELEKRKNKLQINNIGASDKIIAKNKVRIADIESLIQKEQAYRQAMGLEGQAQEAATQLINKKATLTHNLFVEQEAYNASVEKGNAEKQSKKSYDIEISCLEKINKLEIDNINASKSKQAENNKEIELLRETIRLQQELRNEKGLNTDLGNQRVANKQSELKDDLDIAKSRYSAGEKYATTQWKDKASKFKEDLKKALDIYTNATQEAKDKATALMNQLMQPQLGQYDGILFAHINQSNVDSVVRKIQNDTNKIINALKEQHTKVENETKYTFGEMKFYESYLNESLQGKSLEGAMFKNATVNNSSGKTTITFLELVGEKAREVIVTLKDVGVAIEQMENGTFNWNGKADVKEWRDATKKDLSVDPNNNKVQDVINAYNELIKIEDKYQKLRAKVDTGTATTNETAEFQKLTNLRKGYNDTVEKSINLVEQLNEQEKQLYEQSGKKEIDGLKSKYEQKQQQANQTYQAYYDAFKVDIPKESLDALNQTQQLMDQIFSQKQNMSGFQGVFDRAQEEVNKLNEKLKNGQISTTQYTDAVNKIAYDLNNVVAVTNPFDKVSAQNTMQDYLSTLNNGNVQIKNFSNNGKVLTATFEEQKGVVREVSAVWNEASGAITLVDKGTKRVQSSLTTFMDGVRKRFHSLLQYLTIFVSYYRIIGYIKNGIQVVKDLDIALTEMRKVSDETVESLKNFQDVSFDIAKSVGTTAKQIQNSTADWMRLGESLEEAAKSAEVANILLNVSEFESIDEATESLVSMSAAFDDLDKMDIVDKLNQVGNNFAISTDGLATALQSSSSALKTAKNDLDESIALATAANAVVQDPSKVGTGLRTIALRITGKRECARTYSNVWAFI